MHNNTEIKTPNNKLRCLGLRRTTPKNIVTKTPLSDTKVSYKPLQIASATEISSPFTPRLSQTIASSSGSSRRLSLGQRTRDKYKKKKLEFAANNLLKEVDSKSPLDLQQEITKKEQILQRHEKHKEKVDELKNLIAIWTEAFKASMEELSSKIEPKLETEDLIERLGIPADMIDHL